jgi:hypothetical protein
VKRESDVTDDLILVQRTSVCSVWTSMLYNHVSKIVPSPSLCRMTKWAQRWK